MVEFFLPLGVAGAENLVQGKPGDVAYSNSSQMLKIVYGGITDSKINKVGAVSQEDVPKLKAVGEWAWMSELSKAERWKKYYSPSTPRANAVFRIKEV